VESKVEDGLFPGPVLHREILMKGFKDVVFERRLSLFGGMPLSGRKAAEIIVKRLRWK